MVLTLEVLAPQAAKLGAGSRKVFDEDGGTIGRQPDNSWVLPHSYVSSHHASISYRNGTFLIQDTSTNGICINQPDRPLPPDQPYALKSGDCLYIHPYKIQVTVTADAGDRRREPIRRIAPEDDDPFSPLPEPAPRVPLPVGDFDSSISSQSTADVDPLSLLGFKPQRAPARKAPTAADLNQGSILQEHYTPPPLLQPKSVPGPSANHGGLIPDDYDPLAADDRPLSREPEPPVSPGPLRRATPADPPREPAVSTLSEDNKAAAPGGATGQTSEADASPADLRPAHTTARDVAFLSALLRGAGLEDLPATPELAEGFGEILRVVVSGLMDVLRSRTELKDEFRMRATRFKKVDNNPLKFSADVDDALHNLLAKQNPAYLGPVAAFEDAFDDLRDHQLAMLAGMRAAFDALLAEFDPAALERDFEKDGKRSLILGSAKSRYWDQYREKMHAIAKDPDASFRKLFAERFSAAYEEQLERLRAERRRSPR